MRICYLSTSSCSRTARNLSAYPSWPFAIPAEQQCMFTRIRAIMRDPPCQGYSGASGTAATEQTTEQTAEQAAEQAAEHLTEPSPAREHVLPARGRRMPGQVTEFQNNRSWHEQTGTRRLAWKIFCAGKDGKLTSSLGCRSSGRGATSAAITPQSVRKPRDIADATADCV